MLRFAFPLVAAIAFCVPAIAQDPYHVRAGDRIYHMRPDEADLSRHDCYINQDGTPVHRPARDDNGRPQGDTALCRDGTYSFSQHKSGTCSGHGGVQRWD
jgi:Protein of unknown function (DUF3761)